jgi:hypothetical protein
MQTDTGYVYPITIDYILTHNNILVTSSIMAAARATLYAFGLLALACAPALAADYGLLLSNGFQTLNAGNQLVYGPLRLVMQTDGNLVLYDDKHVTCGWFGFNCKTTSGAVIWATGLARNKGRLPNRCVMQSDGNVVVYSSDGAVVWAMGHSVTPDPARPFALKLFHTATSNSETATLYVERYDPIGGWKGYHTIAHYSP